jgi:L-rhamnose-H+ transport protein
LFQGSFILPMTLTREWKWEHTWATFSLLGMLVFNWAIGISVLPHLVEAIRRTPPGSIHILLLLGACWGTGAILFGLGMEKLGMAVGYPVIMGLILSLGALIPLAQSGAAQLFTKPGIFLLAGTLAVLLGIVLCSRAAAQKGREDSERPSPATVAGLTIAIFAGILSCLPNVGLNNAAELTASATRLGAAPEMAGNAAWVIQFTAGFAVNFLYCVFLIARRRNLAFFRLDPTRNLALVASMALMWIGSFYLYGMGAARMGRWGAIIGWPIFISLSILVGNLWGISRGEWRSARPNARAKLNRGLIVILIAVALFALSSSMH